MRPLTIMLLLCVMLVIVSVVAAVVCQEREKCYDAFDGPVVLISSACCAVICVALFYVEFGMQHRTGIYN
jgi:F0F1-type ATP synthase assembly protein I